MNTDQSRSIKAEQKEGKIETNMIGDSQEYRCSLGLRPSARIIEL